MISLTASILPSTPAELPAAERKRRTADLLERAQDADDAERHDLLEEVVILNIPVAKSLASRYRNRGQPIEELEQVACLALTRAVRDFRPDRGEDLLVFAVPSILGELKRHFRDHTWTVRPPRRVQELRPQVFAAEDALAQELGRSPTTHEVAELLECRDEDVLEAREVGDCASPDSLDGAPPGDDLDPIIDRLPATDPGFERSEAMTMLEPAFHQLKKRDRTIVWMRFYEQRRQQQIADELGVTQVQVSRLLQRILRDMRRVIVSDDPGPRAA